jgi:N-carbamoylputrescine amidase
LKVTVCEMPDDRAEFEGAWARLRAHVRREKSDLVLLPEMPFFYWFPASPKPDLKVWEDAVAQHRKWMGRLGELGSPVVLGSRPVNRGGRRLNEGFVWAGGKARGVHYKRYLPDEGGYYEATWYDMGDGRFVLFDAGRWKSGFMICSDLWSMADAQAYGKGGAGLIAVPRCTGDKSVEKWVAGGKVVAVVSGAYCLSSNRRGIRGPATFGGTGWVVDPDGNTLGLTSKGRPFLTAEIDRQRTVKAKKTYPRDALNRA